MKTIMIILGIVIIGLIMFYLGKPKSSEGFDTKNRARMKGCVAPMKHSKNCGAPGSKGYVYVTKGIDDAKEEIWTICPYKCSKGSLSDDISICKYDKQCETVDAKTGKFNHACIIKLNIDGKQIGKRQVKRFSSKIEMEKALGYKICSHKKGEHPQNNNATDTSDMIMNPDDEGEHQTPVEPGGGPGPHGSLLPNPGHPGPGYPDAHGGNPDPNCYPSPPRHYPGHHPGINESQYSLSHSPHAPFEQNGGFVPPHNHSTGDSHQPSHAAKYQCECS
jgi:hypothetical protein